MSRPGGHTDFSLHYSPFHVYAPGCIDAGSCWMQVAQRDNVIAREKGKRAYINQLFNRGSSLSLR